MNKECKFKVGDRVKTIVDVHENLGKIGIIVEIREYYNKYFLGIILDGEKYERLYQDSAIELVKEDK